MKRLAELLANFDDEALAALASRGLVRRAKKDLAAGAVTGVAEEGGALAIHLGAVTVTMPAAGPALAECSCPASGCCRHVLAATLHLMNEGVPGAGVAAEGEETATGDSAPEPAAAEVSAELLAVSLKRLTRWAGKKALAAAFELVAGAAVEIEEGIAVIVRFPALGVDGRFFAGAGLDGAITGVRRRERKKVVAAAVIAFQRRHGLTVERGEPAAEVALRQSPGAPRSREQILAATRGLLEEMVGVGLSHLSPAMRDRLTTLSVSAAGVQLPRLGRSQKALAREVDLLLRRDAQGDEARLFALLAEVYALCRAVESRPLPAVVGRHRSRYRAAGTLELVGVAAWRWRTSSGFRGLSVLFLDPAAGRWASWSDSRPRGVDASFDPARRYEEFGPWAGAPSVRELSGRRIRLEVAKVNDEHRLSASERCRLTDLGPTLPEEADFGPLLYDDWAALRRHAAALAPVGLARPAELDALVVVRPAAWDRRSFDEIRQTFVWELADAAGDVVPIEVVYGDRNELLIRRLEWLEPSRQGVWGLCARLVRTGAGISLYPLSILFGKRGGGDGRILNPTLDPFSGRLKRPAPGWLDRWLKKRGMKKTKAPTASRWRATVEDVEPLPAWSPATERAMSGLEDDLGRLAESGRRSLSADVEDRLRQRAAGLRDLGLELLAESLATLAQGPEPLIRARYLCQVCRQAAVRARITGSLAANPRT